MEFFATGAFQQLYNELDEPSAVVELASFGECYMDFEAAAQTAPPADCCYADVNFGEHYEQSDAQALDYYGIITLDSNNNSSAGNELAELDVAGLCSAQEFSDWEQRLLDNFVEIPELIDFLPERTPLCTDMCDDFLQESNDNLRLASMQSPPAPATPQLSQNAAGEKGYLCTFGNCEKLYAKPAHLKAHLRRHLGEKPYACNWPNCSWRFSRSDELARHRRSHSGVKPYKCDYCAKCFARSDHLAKHRKVHERRLLAASRAGKLLPDGQLPQSVYAVRPGRKRKNQF